MSSSAPLLRARDEEIARLRADKAELVEGLRELEGANEELCHNRSADTFTALIADNRSDQLVRLDQARARARILTRKHS